MVLIHTLLCAGRAGLKLTEIYLPLPPSTYVVDYHIQLEALSLYSTFPVAKKKFPHSLLMLTETVIYEFEKHLKSRQFDRHIAFI